MMTRWMPWLCVLMLFGCAQEKRLGESFIEARRYNNGWHVNARHAASNPSSPAQPGPTAERVKAAGVTQASPVVLAKALFQPVPHGMSHPAPRTRPASAPEVLLPKGASAVPPTWRTTRTPLETEVLPEAIEGRHPAAVPGFILSLGWLLGIIGEAAISYLQMPIYGVPIVAGILASIIGYFVSRHAYRTSRKHPDRYPRFGLAKAARVVSLAVFAPVVIYVGLVLIFVLLLGAL